MKKHLLQNISLQKLPGMVRTRVKTSPTRKCTIDEPAARQIINFCLGIVKLIASALKQIDQQSVILHFFVQN
jgi:hypothetical protein